jgi:hypothetical protein
VFISGQGGNRGKLFDGPIPAPPSLCSYFFVKESPVMSTRFLKTGSMTGTFVHLLLGSAAAILLAADSAQNARADFHMIQEIGSDGVNLFDNNFNNVLFANQYNQQFDGLFGITSPTTASLNTAAGRFDASVSATNNTLTLTNSYSVPTLDSNFFSFLNGVAGTYALFQVTEHSTFTVTTTYTAFGPNDLNTANGGLVGDAFYNPANNLNIQETNLPATYTNTYTGQLYTSEDYALNGYLNVQQSIFSSPFGEAGGSYTLELTTQAVPEPSSLALFGLEGIGLAIACLRRRRVIAAAI